MIKIDGKVLEVKFFPDGTLNMTDMNVLVTSDSVCIEWHFENLIEQVVLYNLVQYFHDIRRTAIVLKLPYVPNARMDRTKNPFKEVHTLKYFCKFINDLGFDKVYVTDVHSPVTMTLLERAEEYTVRSKVKELIDRLDVDYLFFPDKGAMTRYEYLTVRTPFFGVKVRDWNTGEILNYSIENPYNIPKDKYEKGSILIVDDISSYGTTFYNAAKALKDIGFGDVYLYITHAENSILNGKLPNDANIKHIYTTDSIFTGKHDKITIVD